MKKLLVFSAMLIPLLFACSKSPTSSSSSFSNKLTLGTGFAANYMDVANPGTSFNLMGGSVSITFRLESSTDMGGSNVSMRIGRLSGTTVVADTTWTYANPQSYGHIFLSSFTIASAGSYRATGILATGAATVASCDFTVQ